MRVSQKNWKRCVFLNLILVRKRNKNYSLFAKNSWNRRRQHSHSLKCVLNRKRKLTKDTGKNVKAQEVKTIHKIRQTPEDLRTYDFVHCGGKWWNCLQNVVKFILPTKFTLICFHDYNKLTDRNAVPRESLPDDPALVSCKVCNESWVQQLTPFASWTLTAGILLSKLIFITNKRTRLWLQIV